MIGAGAGIGGMGGFAGGATGGGGGGGGGGFGMPQMMMIQMAMQEKNREAADRWRLAQGLSAAMNDSQWLMEHFPNFWGTSYVNPNAGAVDASLGQQNAIIQNAISPMAEQAVKREDIESKKSYELWKQKQELESFKQMMPYYRELYGVDGSNNQSSNNLTYEDLIRMRSIAGR
jgi:hypothetical protein